MNKFYHVARRTLTPGQVLNLTKIETLTGSIENIPIWTADDFRKSLTTYYPEGVSSHGIRYLYDPWQQTKDINGEAYYQVSPLIETTFEYIRKWKFSDKKSRFQSVFACQSLEDAKKIIEGPFRGAGQIYEVECKEYSLADMNLLFMGSSYVGNLIFAEKYWNNERSHNPFVEVLMHSPVTIIDAVK